jgi:hypothetical protein
VLEYIESNGWDYGLFVCAFFIFIAGFLLQDTKDFNEKKITHYFWKIVRPCFYLSCLGAIFLETVFFYLAFTSMAGLAVGSVVLIMWSST